jgi:hypothetical protein
MCDLPPVPTVRLELTFRWKLPRRLHRGNVVVSMGKPLLPMFLCPNQSQRTTLASQNTVVQRNLGGRPRVGSGLGFHRRLCFEDPEPTQIMHVDLKCVCMCDVGLGDAIARSQV